MDEGEVQAKRRQNEEEATERRANILGLPYLDTREFERSLPLTMNLLDKEQMHKDFILPLQAGDDVHPYQFMVTSQTPRSIIDNFHAEYERQGLRSQFCLSGVYAALRPTKRGRLRRY